MVESQKKALMIEALNINYVLLTTFCLMHHQS